jgi:putative hydrolase of the HAD superfamily
MEQLEFKKEEVLLKLDEIDIQNIHRYGFIKERYPYSLGKTYEYFSQKNGKKINSDLKEKMEDLGWQVFKKVPELVEDVHQVLSILKEKYLLILATLGDAQIQENKVQLTGLKKYFSIIYVLKYKNVEEYLHILKERKLDKKDTWIVGNSVRSDLNPGLKLGLNCILIPYITWKYEEEQPLSEKYFKLNCLKEILNYL